MLDSLFNFFKHNPYTPIETKIGYKFKNYNLIKLAFTHRSINSKPNKNFERLELIGDSVLNLVVTDWLLNRYPKLNEGKITKKRSSLVSGVFLSKVSDFLNLKDFMIINKINNNKESILSSKIKSNLYESLIGAIYLDGNLKHARNFIYKTLMIHENLSFNNKNYKGMLIEYSHRIYNRPPVFKIVSSNGPDHKKIFNVQAIINDNIVFHGIGNSKKEAEQSAANHATNKLNII